MMTRGKPVRWCLPRPARRGAPRARDWLGEARGRSGTRYLAMRGNEALMRAPRRRHGPRLALLLTGDDPRVQAHHRSRPAAAAGLVPRQRCVLVELDRRRAATSRAGGSLRGAAAACEPACPPRMPGLLAYARALSIWRAQPPFCSRCGGADPPARAPAMRACAQPAACRTSRASIRRSSCWCTTASARCSAARPAGRPAAIRRSPASSSRASPSRTPCAARCSRRPASRSATIDYHSSQPWPFPASLMLGFRARGEYADAALARWRTRGRALVHARRARAPAPCCCRRPNRSRGA